MREHPHLPLSGVVLSGHAGHQLHRSRDHGLGSAVALSALSAAERDQVARERFREASRALSREG
jgi:hypothetical protein